MKNTVYNLFVELLKQELVPAMGCTEPIAIAYCAAKAVEVLGDSPEKIIVSSSGNMVKNVCGVTVPNSDGLKGIDVAAVLGVVAGNPNKKLEVISEVKPEDIERTKELLKNKDYCECKLIEGVDNLFIIVEVFAKGNSALVEIQEKHTNITKIEKNGKIIFSKDNNEEDVKEEKLDLTPMSVKSILEFIDELDIEDVRDTLQNQMDCNSAISKEGLTNDWGVKAGKTILKSAGKNPNVREKAIAAAAAGSDARMSGCPLPVVINSGSGNQGITLTMPVMVYAEELGVSEEIRFKALALANLIAIHQKRFIGDLSAYCGAVCAATGAASGIAYMNGDGYDVIAGTITNSICTIGGMICDGAKPSCATKISGSVDNAIRAYEIKKNGGEFSEGEGLVKKDIELTIRAVGRMAFVGLHSTDVEILNIMLEK
jgi:L-cysteine desulfidase